MHLYGLIIGLCFLFLLSRLKNTTTIFQLGLGLFCLIGARLYHVFDCWQYYTSKPIEILYTWNGGLGIFGAIIAGLIFIVLYSIINHKSYFTFLDSLTPWLPLVQAISRLGNLVNHEIPSWWIESLANIFLFLFIRVFPKDPTAKYLIGYGLIRFLFEFTRSDTWTVGTIKIGQFISVVFIISGSLLLLWPKKNHPKTLSKSLSGSPN